MTPAVNQPFPEGGLTAWLTVLGGSMVFFCTFGAVQSFGVYQDYYTRTGLSEYPPSDVSWIGSLQVCLMFLLGLPVGRLFDAGYFHGLVAGGSLLYLVSIFTLSLARPHHYYENILAQGVGIGLGMGLLFLPSVSITSHYFKARRSLAMGFVMGGSSLGGVIFPIMQNHIFASNGGFPWGVRAAGFLCLFLLVSANFLMRTRLPSRKHRLQDVEPPRLRALFSDVPFMTYCLSAFFIIWGLFFPFFYLQLFAALHGVESRLTIYAIPILNASSFLGRTIPSFLADIWGPFNVAIPMTVIAGALIFALFGASTSPGMLVFAILYGFFSGAFISLTVPIAASFSKSVTEVGLRVGILCFFLAFAILTGSPIAGALLRPPSYTWYRPVVFAGVVVLFGALLLIVSRGMVARQKGVRKL
ncbi:MFS general substrate transporter [Neolentinus lepideus HHB14362 ss-1]|uniref:MFS general substrate transporter n=1 Tax=Neolentinus lepideus HHB14362 ss-1 TaxID=1314782 RepID=A0A165ULN4_9AGAM|nr:MFS general substrate transporter [Neolentinus lepideus HHB14362 ss-1]